MRTLANALVDGSLSLCKETDPVRKAQLFDQLAAALAERAKAQAGSGDEASAEKLAVCSSRLIEKGVVGNIEKVESGPAEAADGSPEAVLNGAIRNLETLQGVADRLPEGRRARVAKCIETCRQRGQGVAERLRRRVRHRYGRPGNGTETKGAETPDGIGPKRRRGRARGHRAENDQ